MHPAAIDNQAVRHNGHPIIFPKKTVNLLGEVDVISDKKSGKYLLGFNAIHARYSSLSCIPILPRRV